MHKAARRYTSVRAWNRVRPRCHEPPDLPGWSEVVRFGLWALSAPIVWRGPFRRLPMGEPPTGKGQHLSAAQAVAPGGLHL